MNKLCISYQLITMYKFYINFNYYLGSENEQKDYMWQIKN